MKIKKYASGGVYTPFNPPIKADSTTSKSRSGSSGSTKNSELPFKKELIEMIKSKGLPSDTTVFFNELSEILYRTQFTDGTDVPAYMAVAFAKKASDLDQMNKQFDKARNHVIETGTSEDIATSGQFMYVEDLSLEDTREMTLITPTDYLKNPKQYRVLTNKDILHAREHDPNFAFNNSTIIDDAMSAVNLKIIRDYWKNETKALATQSNSGELSQNVQMQDYITGARILQKSGGNIDSSTTLKNEHVQNYLSFLYDSMDEKSKGYLHNYMAVKGISPEGPNILTFMFNNIIDYVGTSSKYSPESLKKAGSSNSEGGGDLTGSVQDNQALRVQQFDGPIQTIVLKCKAPKPGQPMAAFETKGIKYGRFTTKEHNPIEGPLTLNGLLGKSEALLAGDTRSIYIGNKLVQETDRNTVYWDGSELEAVLLPPMKQENGTIRPWFELMEHIGYLNSENKSAMEKDDYINRNNLRDLVKINSSTGKFEAIIEGVPFIVFKAFCSDKVMKLSDNDKLYFEQADKRNGKQIADTINEWVGYNWIQNDNEWDNIYAGNVYIPTTTAWAAFSSSTDQHFDKNIFSDVNRKQQSEQLNKEIQQNNTRTINTNFSK